MKPVIMIIGLLSSLIDAWRGRRLVGLLPDRRACEEFSAERQIAALARALNGDVAAEPFVPGVVDIPPSLRHKIEGTNWLANSNRADIKSVPVAH